MRILDGKNSDPTMAHTYQYPLRVNGADYRRTTVPTCVTCAEDFEKDKIMIWIEFDGHPSTRG